MESSSIERVMPTKASRRSSSSAFRECARSSRGAHARLAPQAQVVAHRHGERVGGVRGLRRHVQAELDTYHLLHLHLVAAAVPRHRQLHLGWRVRPHRQPDGRSRQQRDRPRLADREGGAGVLADERVLDGDLDRLPALDDAGQLAEDVVQALLWWAFATRGDGAARERFEPVALRADDAPARDAQPGVDAEYDESAGWCRKVPPCLRSCCGALRPCHSERSEESHTARSIHATLS